MAKRSPISATAEHLSDNFVHFSERELMFTFVICYMISPARPSSVVGNACVLYSGGCNFPQYFYGIWYLGHPLTSTKKFTEIVPGEPIRRGS